MIYEYASSSPLDVNKFIHCVVKTDSTHGNKLTADETLQAGQNFCKTKIMNLESTYSCIKKAHNRLVVYFYCIFQDIHLFSNYTHYEQEEQEEEDLTLLNRKIADIWTICIHLFYIIA